MKKLTWILTLLIIGLACSEEVMREKEDPNETPAKPIRLERYIESFELDDVEFTPQLEVMYAYDSTGKLTGYTESGFNPDTGAPELQRYFVLSYAGTKVNRINGFQPGVEIPYEETTYDYLPDGRVSNIARIDRASGVNSDVSFAYAPNGVVRVTYTFSNGGSFLYEFDYTGDNVRSDKTTRGTQVCSNGEYTYDVHQNPFRNLGFIDYNLTNISMNNRLTEDVNYLNCAFPTLMPIAYEYEYNSDGYPKLAITHYDPKGAIKESRKEFFYSAL